MSCGSGGLTRNGVRVTSLWTNVDAEVDRVVLLASKENIKQKIFIFNFKAFLLPYN